jgi:hypothetical protein
VVQAVIAARNSAEGIENPLGVTAIFSYTLRVRAPAASFAFAEQTLRYPGATRQCEAFRLAERAYGGFSPSMKRHLNTLAGAFEKGSLSFDPDVVLKTGVRLVRQ